MATTIEDYYALKPGRFGPIHTLEFVQEETTDGVQHRVQIVLSEAPEMSGGRLILEFRGVTALSFRQPDWSVASLGLIEIHELDFGFLVTEEEGNLRMECKHFEAKVENTDSNAA